MARLDENLREAISKNMSAVLRSQTGRPVGECMNSRGFMTIEALLMNRRLSVLTPDLVLKVANCREKRGHKRFEIERDGRGLVIRATRKLAMELSMALQKRPLYLSLIHI